MSSHWLVTTVAGVLCFSVGLTAGIGLAIVKPQKIRQWARSLGFPDSNMQWFHAQTVKFHLRIDACAPRGAVLFIGDSFIQGLCVTEVEPGAINFGIGGDTTDDVLARLPRYTSVAHAGAVVFAVGDNDLRKGFSHERIVVNYRQMLAMIPAEVPVFFCSLTPTGEGVDGSPINKKIAELNRALTTVCASRPQCHYVDLSSQLADAQGRLQPQFDDGDGLHLNAAGNRLCLEKLQESLAVRQGR